MAGRIRTIKPELLENARTGRLDDEAWRLFVSMLLLADDFGNLYGDPERVSAAVFWSGGRRDIRETLARLSRAGLIALYSTHGQPYVSIVGWSEHQRVDKPGKPRVPGPDQADSHATTVIRETPANPRETPAPDRRETIDDQEIRSREPTPDPDRAPARVDGARFLVAWTQAGFKGLPNVHPLVEALNALPAEQLPADVEVKFCAAAFSYCAAILEHRHAKIPPVPERLVDPKHFGNIVEVMLGEFDLSKLAEPRAGPRPCRNFEQPMAHVAETRDATHDL